MDQIETEKMGNFPKPITVLKDESHKPVPVLRGGTLVTFLPPNSSTPAFSGMSSFPVPREGGEILEHLELKVWLGQGEKGGK
ncbi:hypothetical protein CEXT_576981 [Caerostris extrusa]|uniref:Uncharacterized protein n=1 Tax=Caerostris extrusa TaxID=172846 RepID=A0AAV4MNY7_CAEEX|nr:hypothetical protein CEXT_576981 [Caerostris extrusa]